MDNLTSTIGAGVMLAQGTSVPNTWVLANTDGFAIANVLTPGDNSKSSFAYGGIYTASNWFAVLGGTVGSFGTHWQDVMNNNPNSICIPIPAGSYWLYTAGNPVNNQLNSAVQIWWFPMGGITSGAEETFKTLSAAEAAEQGLTPPPAPPVPDLSHVVERRVAAADEFLARFAKALGVDLDEETRGELAELLQRF